MWIFGRSGLDFLLLIVPAYITLLTAFLFPIDSNSILAIVAGLIIWNFSDVGHVYLTIWRTYTHPSELKSDRSYLYAPILLVIGLSSWLYFRIPYFWSFIVYFTLFHILRQFYGITKWYQKLEGDKSPWPGRFVYMLTLIPILTLSFRDVNIALYTHHDFLLYPNLFLLQICKGLFFICLGAWLLYEIFTFRGLSSSAGRFFSILTPAITYGIGLIWGENALQFFGSIAVGAWDRLLGACISCGKKDAAGIFSKFRNRPIGGAYYGNVFWFVSRRSRGIYGTYS